MPKNYIGFVNDNSGSMDSLPAVPVSKAPTKSPIPVTPRVQTVFFMTREEARQEAQAQGKSPVDLGSTAPKGKRWTIG